MRRKQTNWKRAIAVCLTLTALTLTALLGTSATASPPADTSTDEPGGASVALMPISFEDPLPEQDQRALADRIAAAFVHPRLDLLSGSRVARAYTSACPDGSNDTCLRALGRELGVTHVVTVAARVQDRDFEVELQALSVAGSHRPASIEVECLVCGIAEVQDRVAAQAAVLRDRVLIDRQPGRIVVIGSPNTAAVSIDGRGVGRVPYEGEVSSGEHELVVTARGYYDEVVPVVVASGTVERIEIDLEVRAEPQVENQGWWKPVGWSAVGVGSVGVVAGVALLVIDGGPHTSRCDDPASFDVNGRCQWIYATKWAGVGALALGLISANVGATLLILDHRERDGDPEQSTRAAARRARIGSLRVGFGLSSLELSGRF